MSLRTKAYSPGKTSLFIAVVFVMVVLSACGAPAPAPAAAPVQQAQPAAAAPTQPAAAPAKAATEIHVVFQTGGDIINATNHKDDLKDQGISVTTEEIPSESLYEKLMTEFMAQSGAYDLVEFYPTWLGGFSEANYLRPLDDYWTKYADQIKPDDYLKGEQNGATVWKGKQMGIPYDGDVLIFYYRQDLFGDAKNQADFKAKYGKDLKPPETWDDVLQAAEFFDGRDGMKGFSTVASRLWWSAGYWSSVYYSLGGKFIDESNGKVQLDCTPFNKANDIWTQLLKHAPDGVLNYGYTEAKEAIGSGKVAMGLQWATSVFLDPRQSSVGDKLGFIVMPGTKQADGTVLHTPPLAVGKVLAIPAASKHPEEAFKFGMLLSSRAVQIESTVGGTGVDPNRISAWQDPAVVKAWGGILPVAQESLKIGVPDIRVPNSAKYYDVITGELHSVWSGTKTSDEACKAVLSQWQDISQGK